MFKRFRWVFLVMLPVGAIGGLLVMAVVSYLMSRKYESSATIEVAPIPSLSNGEPVVPHTATQKYFKSEFDKIKSRPSLAKVVDRLQLINKWGVDQEAAIQFLKRIVIA